MKRTAPGFDIYFLVNNGQSVSVNTYEFRTLGEPSLWNPEDGTVTAVKPTRYSFDPSTGYTTCDDLVLNGFSSVFVVFGKPALALGPQNITFSPARPLLGDTASIGVDVLDIGPGQAKLVAVEVYDETGNGSAVLIGRGYPIEIDAGGSAHIDISWSTAGAPGNRSIRAAAVLPDGTSSSAGTTVFVNTPPVARIVADRTEALTLEDFRFTSSSTDLDGPLASFSWDFGDGNRSYASSAVHDFSDEGNYTVTLTVTDADGAASSASANVTVLDRPPAAGFTVFPGTDGNATTDFRFNASASTDADGSIRDFWWDFGDGGKAAGVEASHRYGRPGVYGVRLMVTDDDGSTAERVVNITVENLPPVAGFSFEPSDGNVTTAFAFNSTAKDIDGNITRWDWDFGDGTNGTGPSVSHRFPEDGVFVVTLNVTDELGLPGAPFRKEVNVSDLPPVAVADALMKVVDAGRRVTFSANRSSDPDDPLTSLLFSWSFGDGSDNATGITSSHVYSRPGMYNVTLTVTDDDGEASTAVASVEVRAAAAMNNGSGNPPAVEVGLAALIALALAAAILVWRAKRGPPAPPPAGGRPAPSVPSGQAGGPGPGRAGEAVAWRPDPPPPVRPPE
jgi:PKD repeat protein